jgi:molecular chaperone GrpE
MSSFAKNSEKEIARDDKQIESGKERAENFLELDERSIEKPAKKVTEMTKKELIEELHEAEKRSQENYDRYMRIYAEMENIKRRGQKEKEDLVKYANETLIKEILPVIDNLDKALSHVENDENSVGLVEGIELTRNGLMAALKKAGLDEVEAVGKPFDPNFHEAISQQMNDTVAPGHVIMELQKGYLLNGRLVRPSMVVVSQKRDNMEKGTA